MTIALGAGGASAVGAALWMTALPATGCYTHMCDPSTATFGDGRMVDDDTYETNGFDEPWIPYPPNVTLIVTFPPSVGVDRVPVSIEPYLGISITPNESNDSGVNFTNAAGGVVEYHSLSGTGFQALNTTCARYFARFVVHFASRDAGAD